MINAPSADLCLRHRHQLATTRHYENLIIRQQNDQWLRKIRRKDGRVIRNVGRRKIRARERSGIFRACRCGEVVKFRGNQIADIFLCLGCEGIVHLLQNPLPPNTIGQRPLLHDKRQTLRSVRPLNNKLRRPINWLCRAILAIKIRCIRRLRK